MFILITFVCIVCVCAMCEWVSGEKNQCVLCVVIDTDDVMAVFTISHIPSSTARISSSTATVAVVLPGFVRVVASTAISSVSSTATIAKTWRCGLERNEGDGDRVGESCNCIQSGRAICVFCLAYRSFHVTMSRHVTVSWT